MAASLTATVGSRLYIGQAQADQSGDFVEADFTGHSYSEVGWIESIGAFGDEAAEITFDAIGEARTKKLKGTRNAGNMELTIGVVFDDAGQVALVAAEQTNFDFAFRIDFDDTPSGGTTPSKRYFIAKVMSVRETLDTANNVIKLSVTLGINSNVVRVDAA